MYFCGAHRCWARTSTHDLGTILKHPRECTKMHLCRLPHSWFLNIMHARPPAAPSHLLCVCVLYHSQRGLRSRQCSGCVRRAAQRPSAQCSPDLSAERHFGRGLDQISSNRGPHTSGADKQVKWCNDLFGAAISDQKVTALTLQYYSIVRVW